MLAPLNHAFVRYDGAAAAAAVRRSDSTATIPAGDNGDDVAATQCGEATSRRAGPALSGGGAGGGGVAGRTGVCGFFFADGGQETDFAAAVRIRVGEGNRDWPLVQVKAGRCVRGYSDSATFFVFHDVRYLCRNHEGGGGGAYKELCFVLLYCFA